METEGHKCTSIEGGMDKQARDKVVREFRYEGRGGGRGGGGAGARVGGRAGGRALQ